MKGFCGLVENFLKLSIHVPFGLEEVDLCSAAINVCSFGIKNSLKSFQSHMPGRIKINVGFTKYLLC